MITSHPRPLPDQILDILKKILPAKAGLHEPCFKGHEWKYVRECIHTGWVSSVGAYVDRFEAQLAELTQIRRAVAVVNGTAALHIALKLVNVKPGDEVLVPSLSFIASANAVAYCHATPHFVDSEPKSFGIDAEKLTHWLKETTKRRGRECFNKRTGKRIKALIAVHTFGHPCDLDAILQVCKQYHIELLEDAAEALGSRYHHQHVGHHGRLTILSFNGNKIVTTGGGGAILTQDEKLAKLAKHITTTAKRPHPWEFFHDKIGYNYRLPNVNAAMGCGQLEQLSTFLSNKRKLSERYRCAFQKISGVQFAVEPEGCSSNYWLNTILLLKNAVRHHEAILLTTNQKGYQTRPAWNLIHTLPMYRKCPRMDLSTAKDLSVRIINLPSSVFL